MGTETDELGSTDPVLVAVIAAAATAALAETVRVRKIRLIQQARAKSMWAQQGRAAQHASHERERA